MAPSPHALIASSTRPAERPTLYAVAAPVLEADEAAPGSPEPWQLVAAVRPDTPHARALRVLDAIGEALAALLIIAGGAVLTALATLL